MSERDFRKIPVRTARCKMSVMPSHYCAKKSQQTFLYVWVSMNMCVCVITKGSLCGHTLGCELWRKVADNKNRQ